MDYNPELEKAEAELQEQFRRARETRARRPYAGWADAAILFAAGMHFLAAVMWVLLFLVLSFYMLGVKGADRFFILWLCCLPSAAVLLGIACALSRVLDLTSPVHLKPPTDADNVPPMPVQ